MNCDICQRGYTLKEGRPRNSCKECYIISRRVDSMLSSAKYRASLSDKAFDLDREFIIERIKNSCPATSLPFELSIKGEGYKQRHPLSPSLDRIDPDGGYTKDNVRIVCWWYNLAKARYKDEEVLEFCKRVVLSDMVNAKNAGVLTA